MNNNRWMAWIENKPHLREVFSIMSAFSVNGSIWCSHLQRDVIRFYLASRTKAALEENNLLQFDVVSTGQMLVRVHMCVWCMGNGERRTSAGGWAQWIQHNSAVKQIVARGLDFSTHCLSRVTTEFQMLAGAEKWSVFTAYVLHYLYYLSNLK